MKSCILLSGGMDSIACSFWRRPDIALTVDYGQAAAEAEVNAARQVARDLQITHEIIQVDCSAVGGGDLLGANSRRANKDVAPPTSEWWPFRNQLLITLAAAKCVENGANELIIGSVKTDSQYRDGTSEFVQRMSDVLSMQEGNITLLAPAIDLTTKELIKISGVPLSILAWAHSCNRGNLPCGDCRGCTKYRHTLSEAFPEIAAN